MEERKFENYVKKGRANLEMILFGKDSMDKKIRNYFLKNKSEDPTTKVGLRIVIGGRELKIGVPFFIFRPLYKISSSAKYISYHEIGEHIYTAPLTHLSLDFISSKNSDIEFSEITASDVFGDLFASTFSPLTPEQQLELSEKENLDTFINLPLKDYMFVNFQLNIIKRYKTRKEEGYVYGLELKEFYKEMLNLQLGFNDTERKNFQLKLYDTAQRQIGNKLRNYDKITEENIAELFFNAESLISELKT